MNSFYVNLRCKKCGRYVGTIVHGTIGQDRSVGCKQCSVSTNITLRDAQNYIIGDLEIAVGIYYPYDS